MLKAIFFDATGTLIYLPRGVGAHYAEVATRFGAPADASALDRAFRSAWRDLPPPPLTEGPRPDDDKGWWRTLVDRVAQTAGIRPEPFDDFFEHLYERFADPSVWAVFPEVSEVLDRLRPRFRLAIVSNFDGRLRGVMEGLGITRHFDALVISSEVGADKPEPEIFHAACAALEVQPSEALHIGDDAEQDWAGAEAAGLRVFQLERPRDSLRDVLRWLETSGDLLEG